MQSILKVFVTRRVRVSFAPSVVCALMLALACALTAIAQAPVGTISGVVQDPSGAVVPNVTVTITNKATGAERKLTSDDSGNFTAPALPAGQYEVKAEAKGFRTLLREYTVVTGAIIKAEMQLEVGQATDVVTVASDSTAQINYESHSIDGVITRQKIQELPLNGRSFLNLAFLEPGVTVGTGSTAQYNQLFSVSVLGGSTSKTNITIDGGNVRNSIEGGTGMNFSQEIVQEFQLSSTNFDLSTGITSTGSVNVVSRAGGNTVHGSAYFFFRDHNMAAYPALQRNALAPDPFFARRNPGAWISGPIVKNRLFFFTNYEYQNQTGLVTFQANVPSGAPLTGNFANPYRGKLFSTRVDWKINDKNDAYARVSTDWNRGFGPNGVTLPSNWLQNTNKAIQGVVGVISTIKPTLVNDFRFNYTYWRNRNLFADETVCPGCVGVGLPQIGVNGTNVTIGNTSNATQGRNLRRFNFTDNLTWIKGSHRFRFGTELERAPGTGFWGFCDPACTVGLPPEFMRSLGLGPALGVLFPNLPTSLRTNQDFLNLPFAGAVVGVGDPAQPPPFNVGKAKINDRIRFHMQDTWKLRSNLTLNYGLAWNYESTLVNKDLDRPQYLAPLYGSDLSPTNVNKRNFSPSLGVAWSVNNKTVIRAGAGIYYDTEELYRRLQERAAIGPIGNGRLQVPHTSFTNIFSTTATNQILVFNGTTFVPLPNGAALPAAGILTTMTIGQFMQIYNAQIGAVRTALAPSNSLAVRNIQVAKTASELMPKNYPVQRSYQMSFGVQRDLGHDMVIQVDVVRRVFTQTLLGALDLNRFNRFVNGVQAPIIPRCTTAAQRADVNAQCSNGAITFWSPGGRQVYNAVLTKLDKRFTKRYLFTASHALTYQSGLNGIVDMDDYFASWGPQGARHILNVSGVVSLPWGIDVGLISAMSTRGPLMPSISNVDLDGDGTATEPIPGVKFNCFNRGCGKSDLATAVQNFNTQYAGKKDARGQTIPTITLPANYEFGDNWFSSQDLRVTKVFKWGGDERFKIKVFGEMFNIFNTANLGGYSFNLNNTATFGQPTSRAGQVFGSGGPRALQVGGRIEF